MIERSKRQSDNGTCRYGGDVRIRPSGYGYDGQCNTFYTDGWYIALCRPSSRSIHTMQCEVLSFNQLISELRGFETLVEKLRRVDEFGAQTLRGDQILVLESVMGVDLVVIDTEMLKQIKEDVNAAVTEALKARSDTGNTVTAIDDLPEDVEIDEIHTTVNRQRWTESNTIYVSRDLWKFNDDEDYNQRHYSSIRIVEEFGTVRIRRETESVMMDRDDEIMENAIYPTPLYPGVHKMTNIYTIVAYPKGQRRDFMSVIEGEINDILATI